MKVLIAEARPDVRSALRLLLEEQLGVKIDAEVTKVDDLLAQLNRQCADLILLDWELPGEDPANLLSSIHHRCPELRIIALSGRADSRRKALDAGVDDFVSKADAPERLLDAINDISNLEPNISEAGST